MPFPCRGPAALTALATRRRPGAARAAFSHEPLVAYADLATARRACEALEGACAGVTRAAGPPDGAGEAPPWSIRHVRGLRRSKEKEVTWALAGAPVHPPRATRATQRGAASCGPCVFDFASCFLCA